MWIQTEQQQGRSRTTEDICIDFYDYLTRFFFLTLILMIFDKSYLHKSLLISLQTTLCYGNYDAWYTSILRSSATIIKTNFNASQNRTKIKGIWKNAFIHRREGSKRVQRYRLWRKRFPIIFSNRVLFQNIFLLLVTVLACTDVT